MSSDPDYFSGRLGTCARCGITRKLRARHMCRPCYGKSTDDGTLYDYPSRMHTRDDILDYYAQVKERTPLDMIAAALSMKKTTVERALQRARRDGDLRAVPAKH